MIEIIDGELVQDGQVISELTPLTDAELDILIKQFDPTIKSTREWSKKQSSWSGVPWTNMDYFVDNNVTWIEFGSCDISDKVYKAGGVRLLTLYCNRFNFFSAATDLGMNYPALVKWFQRWRKAAIIKGVTPKDLGLEFENTTPI
jgi:hypothetical protein